MLGSARAWLWLVCAMASGAAFAAPADLKQGERLARQWCAACHIVADDQAHGTDNAPTFAAIAARPAIDATRLAAILKFSHRKMPDMHLSRAEAADLAGYIASLRK